jgi:hypothetical protein
VEELLIRSMTTMMRSQFEERDREQARVATEQRRAGGRQDKVEKDTGPPTYQAAVVQR